MKQTAILIVEDENIVAKDIGVLVARQGYQVADIVAAGEDAVRVAEEKKPDLVLMDIMLKGYMDGIEAAERIREHIGIPVVFLTAFADEKTLERAKVTEAFGYLLKPFEERELHITIEMALYKHQMERRLKQHERWLETTLRSIGDAVIATDRDGLVAFMNPKAEALTGWSHAEAVGAPLAQVLRKSHGGAALLSRDGRQVPIEETVGPVGGGTMPGMGSVVVFRDISDRRAAETALRESEERYRLFFEEDLTGDYIASVDGRILECNPAFASIFGFSSPETARGFNIHALYPDPAARDRFFSHLRTRHKLEYYEKEMVRRDGVTVHVVENAIGVLDARGELVRYKGYMFDDTERKRLEEQLRQAQKMESIGTLASGIAHDFNNILNNVLGFAYQLQRHSGDPERVSKYGQTIEKSATRGAELCMQLLSFARANKRERVPTALGAIIDEVIGLTSETIPRNIELRREIEPALLPVLGDKGELYQVILNLVVNARDAITELPNNPPGTISIRARNTRIGPEVNPFLTNRGEERAVELKISDTGVGIPSHIREKIFDPFFTTKQMGQGTGLGLSVVYNIIRNHRGVLMVDSEVGAGTTFTLYLPAAESKPAEQKPEQAAVSSVGGMETILVVDDEPSMLELAKDVLEEHGYSVHTASSGEEAVEKLRSMNGQISLVILDLMMKGMDGAQTFLEMRRMDPAIKAFFCTGYMPGALLESLPEAERGRILHKPFAPQGLLQMVRSTIGGGRM